uniref:C-type lectin domain-containing protein n=1 Tax=Cynoglossus semilaevis TaxID=244447 RepID=A0A3P8V7Y5_CYNSE
MAEDNLVFEANVTVDESKSSQKPTDSSSVLFRTSGYRVYWETATLAYEEASGQEPAAVTAILGEDDTPSKTLVDEIKVSPTVDFSFTPEREDKVSPTTEEDISGTPSLLDETMVSVSSCEPSWDKFHGFCYRHFSQRLSWEVAEQHCRMLGAHLVSIMTPEEQRNSLLEPVCWTGLNDKTIEDDFRWSDGNPLLYENWYRGQPDSYFLSGEDCVVMVWHDDGRWSDVPCNYHLLSMKSHNTEIEAMYM